MTRLLFAGASALGAAAVIWMAAGFAGADALAFSVTAVIGGVYALGLFELLQFRRATASLDSALQPAPELAQGDSAALDAWLRRLHPSLQNSVQLRIEGERVGLPAPVITPYLVGLLVMLGLLGTFVGMVETLQGAVMALEGSTELAAIRNGLRAPIEGLGLAFGTSVAGIAASSMLGLNATISRRDRMLATRRLDRAIATGLRAFSLNYNRQETYRALQQQAEALPQVAEKLQALSGQLEQMGERLSDSLTESQSRFHDAARDSYDGLARSVGEALQASLAQSGRLTAEAIQPLVQETMAEMSRQALATRESLGEFSSAQLQGVGEQLQQLTGDVGESLQQGLRAQQAGNRELVEQLDSRLQRLNSEFGELGHALQGHLDSAAAQWREQQQEADDARLRSWSEQLGGLLQQHEALAAQRGDAEQRWAQAQQQHVERFGDTLQQAVSQLEGSVADHLAQLGAALEEPMTRLIETASETPRAAAEVIQGLREEISAGIERDNDMLRERQQILSELDNLSASLAESASGQRQAVENLLGSSADILQSVGVQFHEQIDGEVSQLAGVAAEFAGSAGDIGALGEAFGGAVQQFGDSNERLLEGLGRIEASLQQSSERSDEQMAYYVAQAREIIDHSILSQKEIIEELRQLGSQRELFPAEAE